MFPRVYHMETYFFGILYYAASIALATSRGVRLVERGDHYVRKGVVADPAT